MTDTGTLPTLRPLTGRILFLLLRHRIATTAQLYELLADQSADAGELGGRLEALRAQYLAVCHHDAWHLTEEGLTVARTQPESLGLCPDQPITDPASAAAHAADALATTTLGLLFRRQHHAAYPGDLFAWDAPAAHHFRDRGHAPVHLQWTARLRTCRPHVRPLLPMDALVDLLPPDASPQTVVARLRDYSRFEGGGPPGTTTLPGPWRRWYPRAPHLLLIAHTTDTETEALLEACRELAGGDPDVAGLLDRGRVGLAVLSDLERHGTAAAAWATPHDPKRHVWTDLPSGTGGGER
ncbi:MULTISPECIES: hypothetical protein [Streptacidiphilus]|uniref:Transcriptional regulator n=1 Tax=Streptacidiphilus cavernicola TaxID=3342716 RepID=A0ABV6UW56_9ACTN|nr:hypothetical protein [Streptacidiphilus jeojiense]